MYLHMLNKEEQELFLSLAILLKISDDEILWDGKTLDELTPATDMKKVSFVISEQEEIVLLGYLKELDKTTRPCRVIKTGKKTFRIILKHTNRQNGAPCR